jgi:hypothetical protein
MTAIKEAREKLSEFDANPDGFIGRRYMGVNLYDFLGKIAEQTIIHYPNDWNIDRRVLWKAAMSDNPEGKRLVWHVCSFGTHIRNERDVFVRDSGAYKYMTGYRQNEPDMFGYIVEITKIGYIAKIRMSAVFGNVFEVGPYSHYARHIRDTALPLDSVTLTYSGEWGVNAGKTVTVSRREYDDRRHLLMSESGNVTAVRFNPMSEPELAEILRREHSRRMAYPIGTPLTHWKKIAEKLAEIRSAPEKSAEPPGQKKRSIKARLRDAGAEARTYNAQSPKKQTKTKNKTEELA